ncbi:MAG: hypothetical protein HY202_04155 [Nitrospirae bacterium]|nr:hypothetical protein [Nitrospirota bacterium]
MKITWRKILILAAMIFGGSVMFGTNQVVWAGSDLAGSEAIEKESGEMLVEAAGRPKKTTSVYHLYRLLISFKY